MVKRSMQSAGFKPARVSRLAGFLLVMTLSGCAGLATNHPGEGSLRAANRHEELGNALQRQGRPADAQQEWKLARELDPSLAPLAAKVDALAQAPAQNTRGTRIQAELEIAQGCYRSSRLKEAGLAWQRVLNLDADNPIARAGVEQLRAEEYLKNSGQEFDQLTQEYYEQGMKAYRRGAWEAAAVALGNAAKLAPTQPQIKKYFQKVQEAQSRAGVQATLQACRSQAAVAEQKQDWLLARDSWRKIIALEPQSAEAGQGLARVQQHLDPLAEKLCQEGQAALEEKHWKEARDKFKKALEYNAQNAEAYKGVNAAQTALSLLAGQNAQQAEAEKKFSAGARHYQAGRLAQAATEWGQACALVPDKQEYRQWLERAQREAAQQQGGKARLAKLKYQEGLQAFQQEDLESALADFTAVLELAPAGAEAVQARKHIARIHEWLK